MKKPIAVVAMIGLAVGLTWAAEQVGGWLGYGGTEAVPPSGRAGRPPSQAANWTDDSAPGNENTPATEGAPATEPPPGKEGVPPSPQELSEEVTSIEDDLARIEEALESDEILEEFTPSEPLSADNPIPLPTDI